MEAARRAARRPGGSGACAFPCRGGLCGRHGQRGACWTGSRSAPDRGQPTGPASTTCCPAGSRIRATELSDEARVAWGDMTARVGQALRGFFHPCAQRVMPWDVQHALRARRWSRHPRPCARGGGGAALDRVRARRHAALAAAPPPGLPHRPERRNTLIDEAGRITGIIDSRHQPHGAHHRPCGGARDRRAVAATARVVPRCASGTRWIPAVSRSKTTSRGSSARCAARMRRRSDQVVARRGGGVRDRRSPQRHSRRNHRPLESVGWDEVARQFGAAGPPT